MAVFDYSRPVAANQSVFAQVKGLISDSVANVMAWNDARVTRNSLSGLTNRELDDLGLVRGDIEDIAQGAFRR